MLVRCGRSAANMARKARRLKATTRPGGRASFGGRVETRVYISRSASCILHHRYYLPRQVRLKDAQELFTLMPSSVRSPHPPRQPMLLVGTTWSLSTCGISHVLTQ